MARLLLAALAFCGLAQAQEPYPSRPIKLIVPFTPGTGMDILARTLGPGLTDKWKVPVVVENKPGASGNIGTEAVAKSPADGYTALVTASTLVMNRSLFRSIPYDPVKDFAPVALLAVGSLALVTHPSVKADSVQELVALARANPDKVNYGSPGNGTPHHLAMELFKQQTGTRMLHVPYKGTGPATQDLLGGQIQVMFLTVHVVLPLVQAGRLKMLAAGGTERSIASPQVPSLAEASGIRNIDTDIWFGVYLPAGAPPEAVGKLNAELNALLKQPAITAALAKQGLQAMGGTPERLAQLTSADAERWARVVREAGIKPD
ncbi:MAG TPA: tripartite tricarboxylate transporter substrate binding protein [Burkholderiales bacterium]|nr:tripartite tricarboxylate transporter substrate binding protein [Burkholderiales bacterium]